MPLAAAARPAKRMPHTKCSGRAERDVTHFAAILAPHIPPLGHLAVLAFVQFTRRVCYVAAVVLAPCLVAGCSAWSANRWDIDTLRDERVVEIEQRLTHDRTIVENPFQ